MHYTEADILIGRITKLVDDQTIEVNIQYGTRINSAHYKGQYTFKPSNIVVNGVMYDLEELDNWYIRKSLMQKQSMFIVKGKLDHKVLTGIVYKLPSGKREALALPKELIGKT